MSLLVILFRNLVLLIPCIKVETKVHPKELSPNLSGWCQHRNKNFYRVLNSLSKTEALITQAYKQKIVLVPT